MSTPLKVVFSLLLIAAIAGLGFAGWGILQLRNEVSVLSSKVSQIERRPAAEAPAPGASKEVLLVPGAQPAPAALPVPNDLENMRRQIAELSNHVQALSQGRGASDGGPAGSHQSSSSATIGAPSGPQFDEETKKAIKDVVREAMNEDGGAGVATIKLATGPMGMNDIDSLAKELGLSETQKAEIQKVWDDREKEMQSMWQGNDNQLPDPQEMEKKMKELEGSTDARVKQFLTVDQAKKYDETKASRRDVMFFGVKGKAAGPGENK